jgi:excisionase family DNA binding protein
MINRIDMISEQYYSIEEVSKILKVTYLTVYRWVQSEKLYACKAGKQYRIKKCDLDKFINVKKKNKVLLINY